MRRCPRISASSCTPPSDRRTNLRPKRTRNRLAQRSFADARRSDEAKDRPLHAGLQPAHRQVVQNAVLHLLQIVVIGVENLLRLRDIDLAARRLLPRQHRQPLDVVAGEAVIGGHRRHARQAAQFLQRFFLHVVGHAGGFDLLPQLFGIAGGFVLLAQFFLDGLHLLAQVVLALRLLHAVLHFALDLVAQLLDFQFLGQVLVDLLQPNLHVGRLQHVLLVARRQRRQRGGDEVDHAAGIVDVSCDRGQLIRQGRRAGHDLLEQRQHIALQRFDLGVLGSRDFGDGFHRRAHERRQLGVLGNLHPLQAFGKDKQALVGHAHNFVHDRQGARRRTDRWAAASRPAPRAAPRPRWSCLRPTN